ncbi:MAG: GAF domain-containing protein, partial [Desulfobacterales bacterium]
YLMSVYNYLLFHSLAEIFSVIVACGIFVVAWNSRGFADNTSLLFLGIAYLFVGGLDLVHTLSYKGMGIFPGNDANRPTQLWIAARYVESLSLLTAPFLLGRKLRTDWVFSGYLLIFGLLLGSILKGNLFPGCFIEGIGLTPFKKISEYMIALILLASMGVLVRHRQQFDARVLRLLLTSIGLSIGSELAFTFYIHVYGVSNLIGHYLKIVSFYLIYIAIIETGLTQPHTLLFRNLKQSEGALALTRDELERRVAKRTAELSESNALLQQEIAQRKRAEQALRLNESRLEALVRLGQMTGASAIETADFVLEQAVALTKSKMGFLGFMNDTETEMAIHAWSKAAMAQCSVDDQPIHFPIDKAGIWGEAVRHRKPTIINDYSLAHPAKRGLPPGHAEIHRLL